MQLYNSASFFGRTYNRRRRRSVHHAAAHHHNPVPAAPAAPAAAPVPGLPVRTVPITGETMGEDAVMIDELSINDHIGGGPDNISLIVKTGRNYRVSNTRRSDFTRLGNTLYVYECRANAPEGYGAQVQHIHPAKLADLSKVGLSIGGGFVDMSRGRFTPGHQVYLLEPTRRINRIADHRFMYGDGVGNFRCQAKSGGQVFDLYPAQLSQAIDLTAFGRRRRNRSSKKKKRTSRR